MNKSDEVRKTFKRTKPTNSRTTFTGNISIINSFIIVIHELGLLHLLPTTYYILVRGVSLAVCKPCGFFMPLHCMINLHSYHHGFIDKNEHFIYFHLLIFISFHFHSFFCWLSTGSLFYYMNQFVIDLELTYSFVPFDGEMSHALCQL